jgi:flagellar hook-basal body complex protein FliE
VSGIESIKTPLLSGSVTVNRLRYEKDEVSAQPTAGGMLQNFGKALNDQMQHINTLQSNANQAQETYAMGGDVEIHTVMLASEKADMALQLAMQVRNKAVSAYQEISRMSV